MKIEITGEMMHDLKTTFMVSLARDGLLPDLGELLLSGNDRVRPRAIDRALQAVAHLIADMVLERAAEFADDAQDFALSRRIRALKEPTP